MSDGQLVVRREGAAVPHPFGWYVDWVRSSPGNARQIEKLVQTFAMVLSDPGNLINMESCWSVSKLYSFMNDAIINTAERRVPMSELLAIALHAVQEVECLMELAVRKYKGHVAAWNAMLALECVKCACNLLVHRQFFLVRWMSNSMRLALRRLWFFLVRRRRVVRRGDAAVAVRETAIKAEDNGMRDLVPQEQTYCGVCAETSTALVVLQGKEKGWADGAACARDGAITAMNDASANLSDDAYHFSGNGDASAVQLVIPRVISQHRDEHRHYAPGAEELLHLDPDEAALLRDEAEAVPFTWIDLLGMGVDLFMLVRPVLLVAAARHVFLRSYPSNAFVAMLPGRTSLLTSNSNNKDVQSNAGPESKTVAAAAATTTVNEAKKGSTSDTEDHMGLVRAAIAASPRASLFPSWKLWCGFALLDLLATLLARFIRRRRVPVVYITEDAHNTNSSDASNGSVRRIAGSVDQAEGNDGPKPNAEVVAAEESVNAEAEHRYNGAGMNGAAPLEPTSVPAVVSRDSLRVQQALRNLALCFLRDPFFATVMRQYIARHFVNGFVNRIPLLGSLISYQVGYFLSMQHYSFLYSVGQ